MQPVYDTYNRGIDYLRISVTDRCNLRCIYCMPPEGIPLIPHDEILSFEEITAVVRVAVDMGINKIRLTGGEPLVRSEIAKLISMIASIDGIKDISMSTNGILLSKYASELTDAGLNRVNISLDTLRYDRFKYITRTDNFSDVLKGIDAAFKVGLNPVKINMVPLKGVNEDEILDFAKLTLEEGWHVRFIEHMSIHENVIPIPNHILFQTIETLGQLEPFFDLSGNGPARYYRLPGASGTIGFISPVSEPFCQQCNRLRLSSSGILYPCLFSEAGIDIKQVLRSSASSEEIKNQLKIAIKRKPEKHPLANEKIPGKYMSRIGG